MSKQILAGLSPERVFYYFEEMNQIPRGSGNMEGISAYIAGLAEKLNLAYVRDDACNVIIRKPASKGCELAPCVMLQGHMDLVAEKTPDSDHDFQKDPLDLFVEGDLIGAKNTTLGGDDGIACAMMLAILEDDSLIHPELECVFTVDEEIGMLGADALDASQLKSRILLNVDSEAEGILTVSCAGGMTMTTDLPVKYMEASGLAVRVTISGLLGGHSGVEIDKIRGNSNILAGRFLFDLSDTMDFALAELAGGSKDNAIPRETGMLLLIDSEKKEELETFAADYEAMLRSEFTGSDDQVTVRLTWLGQKTEPVLNPTSFSKVVFYLMQLPNGVMKMSAVIPGLVETSLNLGILDLTPGGLHAVSSLRSSVNSEKEALANKIALLSQFLGGECSVDGVYPAWEFLKDSPLQDLCCQVYRDLYGSEMKVEAIHAGLECGIFYDRLPGLDCVSYGPNMQNIHTTEERLSISSTKRIYDYTVELLRRIALQ